MQQLVVGFMLDQRKSSILLVEKIKPDWQRGLYNGVGGKVEPGEACIAAMARECVEETGIKTITYNWELIASLNNERVEVRFYRAMFAYEILAAVDRTMNDVGEKLELFPTYGMPLIRTIPNLQWLVPLAVNFSENLQPHAMKPLKIQEIPIGI